MSVWKATKDGLPKEFKDILFKTNNYPNPYCVGFYVSKESVADLCSQFIAHGPNDELYQFSREDVVEWCYLEDIK